MFDRKNPSRWLLGLVVCVLARHAAADEPRETTARRSAQQIQEWIEQLDHAQFGAREAASRNLLRAGAEAIDPLTTAAKQGGLEVVVRAVKVLSEIAVSDDDRAMARAKLALESLSQPRLTAVADHAASALQRVYAQEHDRALKRLVDLGATFGTETTRLVAPGSSHVVLGKNWRGGDDGLAWLRPLRDLKLLSMYGAPVTDEALAHIRPLEGVTRIELYGTKISVAGAERLRKALPLTEIEFRRGALLGVTGSVTALDCRFTDVRPGSAADKAGLQTGDLVLRADDKAVSDFRSLTDVISTKAGGDHLKLEIQRDGKTLTVDVVLGEWE